VIPSFIIASSPQEFSYVEAIASPFTFLAACFFQSFGLFFFWMLSIYFLFNKKIQTFLCAIALPVAFIFLVNTFCFSGEYGYISTMLTFENGGAMKPDMLTTLLNFALMAGVIFLLFFLLSKNKQNLILGSVLVVCFALAGISVVNSYTTAREFARLTEIREADGDIGTKISPIIPLSTEGKNVVIIMLDRAVSGFFPEVLAEIPYLRETYAGFTYYPNTISFGGHTLMGVPPLFGGYQYTPEEINRRSSEPLVQKHNEALLVMPRIFSENGFNTVVTDSPWANYSWIPDTRIYKPYPAIEVYNTKQRYTDIWFSRSGLTDLSFRSEALIRNFLWLSFLKISPPLLRDIIYDNGEWLDISGEAIDFRSVLDSYAVLDFLPELTTVQNVAQNNFTFLVNDLTHEPRFFLQAPDYTPVIEVTDKGSSKYSDMKPYHVTIASIRMLGEWLEFLKQNNVYDNTRIIIVSDHGRSNNIGIFTGGENLPFLREEFNPLLLVKDFNAKHTPIETDMTFMTQADVPTMALSGVIQNPVNPFTGKPVNSDAKEAGPQKISISTKWSPHEHSSNTFNITPDEWYLVHDNIFDENNWEKAGN
jgi:hypothetical protein